MSPASANTPRQTSGSSGATMDRMDIIPGSRKWSDTVYASIRRARECCHSLRVMTTTHHRPRSVNEMPPTAV